MAAAASSLLLAGLWAAPARAADRIYWANYDGASIAWANLDGSGGADLPTSGAPFDGPMGMAIDSGQGRIYWVNAGVSPGGSGLGNGTTIGWANLDGGGGGQFATTATVAGPHGLAIDPATNTIYWPNDSGPTPNTIEYSHLDGSGAGLLNTSGTSINEPRGLALDPAAGRIYWANHAGNTISYANLDGSGGYDINTTGATPPDHPEGVAVDPTSERIYWGDNVDVATISYANLDQSGGNDVPTMAATLTFPHGVAVDPGARVYWANNFGRISYANLDGSGGNDLPTPGASLVGIAMPLVLKQPVGTGAPSIDGHAAPGSRLHCGRATWASDLLPALLYRAPQSTTYAWRRNGDPVDGTSRSIVAHAIGDYRCLAIATNAAGSTTQRSDSRAIFKLGRLKRNKRNGTARLKVTVPDSGKLNLSGRWVRKQRPQRLQGAVAGAARAVRAGTVSLKIKPKGKAKKRLRRTGKAKVKVSVSYRAQGEGLEHQKRTLRLRESVRR